MNRSGARLTTAAVVPLLMLATACGGSGDESAEDAKQRTGSSRSPEAAGDAVPVLDEAQLRKALVADGDLEGYRSEEQDQAALTPQADRAECQPLADLSAYGTGRTPEAQAFASRTFAGTEGKAAGNLLTVSLLSYGGRDATATLEGVRSALEACGDGFETSGNNGGRTVEYTSAREDEAPTGGDEAILVELTGEIQGAEVPMNVTVVRSGSTLVQFLNLSLKDPSGAAAPQEAVTAQLEKLAAAAG